MEKEKGTMEGFCVEKCSGFLYLFFFLFPASSLGFLLFSSGFFLTHSFIFSFFEPFQALSFLLRSNRAYFLCLVGRSLLFRFSYVDIRRVKRLWILNMGLSGNWVSLCISKRIYYISFDYLMRLLKCSYDVIVLWSRHDGYCAGHILVHDSFGVRPYTLP